jgi:hypothetical protein
MNRAEFATNCGEDEANSAEVEPTRGHFRSENGFFAIKRAGFTQNSRFSSEFFVLLVFYQTVANSF